MQIIHTIINFFNTGYVLLNYVSYKDQSLHMYINMINIIPQTWINWALIHVTAFSQYDTLGALFIIQIILF